MTLPTLIVFAYRNVSVATLLSTLQVSNARIVVVPGEALISRGRSIAATRWMNETPDSDVLIMTDDDFHFTDSGIKALVSLCRETKGIVAGVTPLRSCEYSAIVPLSVTAFTPWNNPKCPPMPIRYAGGLIAYHRTVFERLAKTLPLLHNNTDIVPPFYPFFHPMIYDDKTDGMIYLSEDYACHERAGVLGIPVWVQPACPVGHMSEMLVTPDRMDRLRKALS